MTRNREGVVNRDTTGDWLRKHQWRLIGMAIASGIVVIFCMGYLTADPFVRDFAANLAADAVVAVVAFFVVHMALGLRERQQRSREAKAKALSLLATELMSNQHVLSTVLQALRREVPIPAPIPTIDAHAWTLLLKGALVGELDGDLLWKLKSGYEMAERAVVKAERWQQSTEWEPSEHPPADLVSYFEAALNGITDAVLALMEI